MCIGLHFLNFVMEAFSVAVVLLFNIFLLESVSWIFLGQ